MRCIRYLHNIVPVTESRFPQNVLDQTGDFSIPGTVHDIEITWPVIIDHFGDKSRIRRPRKGLHWSGEGFIPPLTAPRSQHPIVIVFQRVAFVKDKVLFFEC